MKNITDKPVRHKVLVAEDNDLNFKLIKFFLKDEEFIVTRAKNGKEAVNLVTGDFVPDIILMDIRMPVMDGFEATRIIRTLFPKLPIIAQTAYNDERLTSQTSGFSGVIYKPYDKNRLFSVMERFISI
jgi:CheY-like chemotaxis protein